MTVDDRLQNGQNALLERDKNTVTGLEALRFIRKLWPQIFRMQHPKPLQIGLDKALIEQNQAPAWLIKKAIKCYVNMDRYLESVIEGKKRIDINGLCTGSRITLSQAVRADYILYYRYLKRQPMVIERHFIGKLRLVRSTHAAEALKNT